MQIFVCIGPTAYEELENVDFSYFAEMGVANIGQLSSIKEQLCDKLCETKGNKTCQFFVTPPTGGHATKVCMAHRLQNYSPSLMCFLQIKSRFHPCSGSEKY